MNVEELHAFFEPIWQLIGRHQRPGDLAGGADLVDGETDLVDDGLRPGLAEGWRRRGYPMFCDKSGSLDIGRRNASAGCGIRWLALC